MCYIRKYYIQIIKNCPLIIMGLGHFSDKLFWQHVIMIWAILAISTIIIVCYEQLKLKILE